MGVGVDAAGDHVRPGGVDLVLGAPAGGRVGAVGGEGRHPAVLDEDVGVQFVGGGDDEAAADDRTVHGVPSGTGAGGGRAGGAAGAAAPPGGPVEPVRAR